MGGFGFTTQLFNQKIKIEENLFERYVIVLSGKLAIRG